MHKADSDAAQGCVAAEPDIESAPAYCQDSSISGRLPIIPAAISNPAIDGLKFRIVARGSRHYFKEVRFRTQSVSSAEGTAVREFLEGRCLETLRREQLAAFFGCAAFLANLQELVSELQQVLCD